MSFAQQSMDSPYESFGMSVAQAPANARVQFIRKTYTHLAAAIYAFAAIEFAIFTLVPEATLERISLTMFGGYNWLIVIGAFVGASWIADSWARSDTSVGKQYLGLMLYVTAQAVIFVPILFMAHYYSQGIAQLGGARIIPTAGVVTLALFAVMTAAVFVTGKDFSFLRTALMIGGFAALGLMAFSILFGFNLGVLFTVGMIVLACGYILYDTSNIMHHYRTDQHVAASLALFASVALLFWYVLRLLMYLSNRD